MDKTKKKQNSKPSRNGKSLEQQVAEARLARPTFRQKERRREKEDGPFIDEATTKKILRIVETQRNDDEDKVESTSYLRKDKSDSEEESDEDAMQLSDNEDHIEEENDIDMTNEAGLSDFSKFEKCNTDTLISMVRENETEIQTECSVVTGVRTRTAIEPSLRKNFIALGQFLKSYRSGKLPKLFKMIPQFKNWKDVVELTCPEEWGSAAIREATRIFIPSFKEAQGEEFLKMCLLPRVRDAIAAKKERPLDAHLWESLKKALFKPLVFMGGFLIPLCSADDFTLREASIISSPLAKLSIPAVAVAAALHELIKLPFSGPRMSIIQTLLEKKHSLPISVVLAITDYFIGFAEDKKFVPTVIWYNGLHLFAQICKNNIDEDRRKGLLKLVKIHHHRELSDLISKEILAGQN